MIRRSSCFASASALVANLVNESSVNDNTVPQLSLPRFDFGYGVFCEELIGLNARDTVL